jgi:signal peptidase II
MESEPEKDNHNLHYQFKKKLGIIAFSLYLLDNFSKFLVLKLVGNQPIHIIGSFLQIQLAVNSGAAFSSFQHYGIFLTVFSLIILLLIFYYGQKLLDKKWLIPLGLLAGGALGNLSDRLFRAPYGSRGNVVDWIELAHFTIFNIADLGLTIGGIWCGYLLLKK